jgi:HEAT repeat protein
VNAAFFRRHPKKLVLLLAVAVFCVWLLRPNRVPDPWSNGRPLSHWVFLVGGSNGVPAPPEQKEEAIKAVRELGTNAVPSLMAWMNYEPTITRNPVIFRTAVRLPQKILASRPVQRFLGDPHAGELAQNAAEALGILGPAAAPAVPELTRRASVPWSLTPSSRRDRAMLALAGLGPPALPVMATHLSSPDGGGGLWSMACISRLGTNAYPLVPLIVKNLNQTNGFVAMINARMLGELKLDPELVIPALTRSLRDPRRDVRMEAPNALAEFGELARTALPALTNALADPDPDVRGNSQRAIDKIAPKAPTNPPAQ